MNYTSSAPVRQPGPGTPPELDVNGSRARPTGCTRTLHHSTGFLDSTQTESRLVPWFQHLQESVSLSVEAQAESQLATRLALQTQIQETSALRNCPDTGGPS